ncbi:MAG: hypothetical protein ACOX5T_03635 [Candidatus Cryptobacteroides sp.]
MEHGDPKGVKIVRITSKRIGGSKAIQRTDTETDKYPVFRHADFRPERRADEQACEIQFGADVLLRLVEDALTGLLPIRRSLPGFML